MYIKVNNKQEEIQLLKFLEKNNYFHYNEFEKLYNDINSLNNIRVDYNNWYFYLYGNKFVRGCYENNATVIGFTTVKKFLRLKKLEKCNKDI